MIPEPFATLLFFVVVPLAIQLLKLAANKLQKPLPEAVVQAVAFLISAAFVALSGGFAGIQLPVYSGDVVAYAGAVLALVPLVWGPIELLYRIVFKAIFEKVGLA